MNWEAIFSTIGLAGFLIATVATFFDLADRLSKWFQRRRINGVHAKVTLSEMYDDQEYAKTRNAAQSLMRGGRHGRT